METKLEREPRLTQFGQVQRQWISRTNDAEYGASRKEETRKNTEKVH